MQILIYSMLTIAILQMAVNIVKYRECVKNMRDVLSTGGGRLQIWKNVAMVLLIFFFFGDIGVTIFGDPDVVVSGILFGSSIFIAIMITIILFGIKTVKERSIDVAEVLFGVIDARDPNLNGHSRHVQNLTMLLYQHIPNAMKSDISSISLEYAALMHDVGKLGVPEKILNKPEKLNTEEWKIMKSHPALGIIILEPLSSFTHIMPWILYHHERIDGTGYNGLKGDEIPLASRMIAVADTYSAITMKRSYKDARSHEEAMSILKEVSGTQLDSELVEIFAAIPFESILKCAPKSSEI